MNKSYRKNIWRTIRHSISRFGAIFAIVALGVGFLAGLMATTPDMRYTADEYFDKTDLFDVRVVSTLGLTDEDVTALRAVEGVADAMPSYSADMMVQRGSDGETLVTRIHSMPDTVPPDGGAGTAGYLNELELLEGRLPQRANECVALAGQQFGGAPVNVGDTLLITDDNKNPEDTFAVRSFTVVGTVSSSYYFSFEREPASVGNGSLALVLFAPDASFASDMPYTNIFLTLQGAAALNSLSEDYTEAVGATIDRIEAISGARCEARLAEVKGDATTELNDAKQEYTDAKAEAEQKLADAEAELANGRREVADGEKKLTDAKKELDDGEKKLTDGKAEYAKQSAEGYQKMADAQTELNKGRATLAEGKAKYEDGKKQFDAGKKQYEDGKKQYDAGVKQLTEGEAFVAQYQPMIEAAEAGLKALTAQYGSVENADAALGGAVAAKGAEYQTRLGAIATDPTAGLSSDPAQLAAQLQYLGTQAALDSAMLQSGYTDEAAFGAGSPETAQAVIATRNAAKAAVAALDADGSLALIAKADHAVAAQRSALLAAGGAYISFQQSVELAKYRPKLDEAVALIAVNKPVLEATKLQLEAAKQKIDASQKELDVAKKQLDDGEAELRNGEAQLADGRKALETGLAEAAALLTDAEKKLADGRKEYAKGVNDLDEGRRKLADGELEYADGKAEADKELADAADKLRDAEREIAKIEQPEWYVLDRMSNVSYNSFSANVEKVEAVATVFPVFFFLVAALVALTTMTRMVEEERMQIGTMKALGYKKGTIMAKYVFYAMTATVTGSIFGLLVGFKLFPTVIWNAYSMMYILPDIYCQFNWKYAILGSGAAIFSTLAATLNACWIPLHEAPAQLMRPRAPKAGKRIFLEHLTPIWKRMKFTHKVTARNLFLYKKRFFMTVLGIAGCTGLLVTGFGLHDSISDIITKQFGEIFTYDLLVSVKQESGLQNKEFVAALGDSSVVDHAMAVHQEKSSNTFGSQTFTTYLFVPEDEARLAEVVTLRDRKTHAPVAFEPDKGIVITEKMAERTGYGVGDTIKLKNNDDIMGEFVITGIAENYVENYVYLSADLYKQQFGYSPEFITLAARMVESGNEKDNQAMRNALSEKLLEIDDVASVSYTADIMSSFSNMLTKIDTIVVVLIISAGLLAFVVLYNLTNINITEREKEIATIKVLGFFDREVSGYVYRESAMLTLIGGLVGMITGVLFHQFVIRTVEVDAVMFGRDIAPLSYVYSFALTILFSLIVNAVMQRKLRRVDMVASMKAPE